VTSGTSTKRPAAVSATSAAVLDILAPLTMFPWPLLKTQAMRHGLDPAALEANDVWMVLDDIVKGIERFTSPEKADIARAALRELAAAQG
jgi:hypothetical protein